MEYLAANGWIEDDPTWQSVKPGGEDLEGIRVTLTDAGLAKVRGLEKVRGNKAARVAAIRVGVLAWLYAEDAVHAGHPAGERAFFKYGYAVFEGELFSGNELRAAYAWLYRKGLVAGTDPDDARQPIEAYLTDAGVQCVERNESVDAYVEAMERRQENRSSSGHIINNFGTFEGDFMPTAPRTTFKDNQFTSTGNVAIGSSGFGQTYVDNSIDLEKVRQFAELIAQIAPTLGLGPSKQQDLEADVDELHAAVSDYAPDGKRVRPALKAVLKILRRAGSSAANQVAISMGDDLVREVSQDIIHQLPH